MGWLRVFNKSNTVTCVSVDGNWSVFKPYLRSIQCRVLFGHCIINADIFRWFSTCSEFGAYVGQLHFQYIVFL